MYIHELSASALTDAALFAIERQMNDNQWHTYKLSGSDLKSALTLAGFITTTSDTLVYYYTKSQTYSKTEVNALIESVKNSRFEKVETLPVTGESNVIYLVPRSEEETNNVYDEYIWLDEAWEKIGSTDIDLSGYVTTQALNTILADYMTTSAFNTAIANYYNKSEINSQMAAKVDKEAGKGLSTNDYTTIEKDKLAGISPSAKKVSASNINGNIQIDEVETTVYDDSEIKQDLSTDTATVEGNPLNFTTLSAQKAVETVISLEPIQDLHGYDHPWPAGGGKNKLPMTVDGIKAANTTGTWSGNVYTANGITWELQPDGTVIVNGTATANSQYRIPFSGLSGNFYFNGCPSGGGNNIYDVYAWDDTTNARYYKWNGTTSSGSDYGSGSQEVNIPEGHDGKIICRVFSGVTVNNILFKPMIRLATETDPTFAPYENKCPIDGRTETSLVGCGKNLVNVDDLDLIQYNSSGGQYLGVVFEEPGTYTVSATKVSNDKYIMARKVENGVYNDISYIIQPNQVAQTYTATITKNDKLLLFINYSSLSSLDLAKEAMVLNKVQVEFSQSATSYEPFVQSNNLTIQFGEKVYGGTVELEKGTVTVTWGYIAEYNGETLPGEWISDRDVYAPNTSPSMGAEVAYELAAPRSITLTPNEISLLLGVNVISTDGDSISLTYRDGKVATLGDLEGLTKKIADCEDVEITDLQAGDSLVWDATAGKWKNQQSTNTHVYSTTEQVVGTWIDGSTLYEKSYFVSSPTKGSTQIIQDANVANIEHTVKSQGSFQRDVGSYVTFESLDSYESSNFHSFLRLVKEAPSSNEIGVAYNITLSDGDISNLFITIQYTKTTPSLLMQSTPTEELTPADESESTDENR